MPNKCNSKSVFFCIDSLSGGGAERVFSQLANQLALKSFFVTIVMLRKEPIAYELSPDVHLIYLEEIEDGSSTLQKVILEKYLRFRTCFVIPFYKKIGFKEYARNNETAQFFNLKYGIALRSLLKKSNPDIAFGVLMRSAITLKIAAKHLGIRTVFCERNNPDRPDETKAMVQLRNKYCFHYLEAVFQTETQSDYYRSIQKKYIISNPVKDGLPAPYKGERRHEIVNFCRLEMQKNLKLLIKAFALFHDNYHDYTLRIYGRGEQREELEQYIVECGISDCAFIEDYAADVHRKISDAAMFVSTSDFEGISNSMLEAMAIGLPCICTDCDGGGARAVIHDGINGLLVPKGNAHAVFQAMKKIAEDKNFSRMLSHNAVKINEELSLEKISDKWKEVING